MQRVHTISLNRVAFQFEEDAYNRLSQYIADATAKLAGNPDRAEILADLEQAIADQCNRRRRPDQNVITMEELQPALEAVGSVEVPASQSAATTQPSPALQQVSEGALISGVCQGLARTSGIDVTLIRVIAVVLLFATGGAMIVLYLVLMFLIPFAPLDTSGPAVRPLPARCREFVTLVRAKLGELAG